MKVGFFEESVGVKSFTRLAAAVLIVSGLIVGIVGMLLKFADTAMVAGAFVGSGVLTKIISKFAEKKDE